MPACRSAKVATPSSMARTLGSRRSVPRMLDVTTTAWIVTIGAIVALLALDLGVSAWRPHQVGFREAAAWSVFYVGVAIAFGVIFGSIAGWDFGAEYFAGYIVENSLSVEIGRVHV